MVTTSRRTRAQQSEENRAELLATAREVFRTRGYAAATLQEIAESAGFSKGLVCSQFASKGDLFLAVLEQRIDERARENDAVLDEWDGVDPREVGARLNEAMSRSEPGWRLAVIEFRLAAARDAELRARYEAVHRVTIARLAALLDALFARAGTVPPAPAEQLAVLLLAIDNGLLLADATSADPLPPDALSALLQRLLFDPA